MSGFTIPNTPEAPASQNQAEPDSLDFQILGKQNSGVVSGCAVTPGSSTSVDVASGEILVNGVYYPVSSATSLSLSAYDTLAFFDVIVARVSGSSATAVVVKGTEDNNPRFPQVGTGVGQINLATDVVLATVWRDGALVDANRIIDKRIFVRTTTSRTGSSATGGASADTFVNTSWSPGTNLASPLSVKVGSTWYNLAYWPSSGNFTAGTITATFSGNLTGNVTGNSSTATLASKASTLAQNGGNGSAMTFNWSGQSGQPSWLWGSNDGVNHYVYNPSNFSVSYATTATQSKNLINGWNNTNNTIFNTIDYLTPSWFSSMTVGVDNAYHFGGTFVSGFGYFTTPSWSYMSSYSYQSPSDRRLKDNIQESSLGLDFINSLNPVSYKMKVGKREVAPDGTVTEIPGVRTHYGFIAQEVEDVVNSSAGGDFAGWIMANPDDEDSAQSLNYMEFISPIVKAIQELSSRIEALEAQLG